MDNGHRVMTILTLSLCSGELKKKKKKERNPSDYGNAKCGQCKEDLITCVVLSTIYTKLSQKLFRLNLSGHQRTCEIGVFDDTSGIIFSNSP